MLLTGMLVGFDFAQPTLPSLNPPYWRDPPKIGLCL